MMNLYLLNKEFENALINIVDIDDDYVVDVTTGEVITQEEYDKTLNALSLSREDKIKNCVYYTKSLELDEDVISQEIKRLQTLKRTKTNAKERMKNYILKNVDKGEKLDFATIRLSCIAGLESIEIDADADVPQEYCMVKIEPSKTELKKALKSGIEIDGVRLVRPEKRLMIK